VQKISHAGQRLGGIVTLLALTGLWLLKK